VNDAELSLSAAANYCHYAVAVIETLGSGATSYNLACKFEARDVERRTWWRWIGTAQLELIGAVETGSLDSHQDLTRPRQRIGALGDYELLLINCYGKH
jgi:hypothetical protein